MTDPVERLARDDKWQLGAGDGGRFAPPLPRWLDVPGFWDEATVDGTAIAPLFTVTVLDDDGRERVARVTARRWTPAELTVQYRLAQGLTATEVRTAHPGGIFVSEWRFAAYRPARIHLVAWTAQPGALVERGSAAFTGALAFTRAVEQGDGAARRFRAELGVSGGATSWHALRAEREPGGPAWHLTPFAECWQALALPRAVGAEGAATEGTFYAAVHRALAVDYGGASATFAMRLVVAEPAHRSAAVHATAAPRLGTFGGVSRRRWSEHFASVPQFRSSDPYLETSYWYGWYCVRLHGGRAPARDLRWLRDRGPAREAVRRLARAGSTGAAVALAALDATAPEDALIRELHPDLARAADRLVESRDAEESGLFDLPVEAPDFPVRAGAHGAERAARLKGVDVTVDAYALFRALEMLAPRADADPARWTALAARTRAALRARMWDGTRGMFSDVNAATGAATGVSAAVCFLPFGTDLVEPHHIPGLERHLLDPAEFATAFPVPSLSAGDPRFSAEGIWEGRVLQRPWNGRAWPALSRRLVDALAHTARTHAPHLREPAASLLRRFVRTMFHAGDLHRVNVQEHYNPLTGHAALVCGTDDPTAGSMTDLMLTHVMGIGPRADGVTVDPLPLGLERVEVRGVLVRGRELEVVIAGDEVVVRIDGGEERGSVGTQIIIRD